MAKVFQQRITEGEEKITLHEAIVKENTDKANEAEQRYDEVCGVVALLFLCCKKNIQYIY